MDPGTYTYYAQATDEAGLAGAPASTTSTVIPGPPSVTHSAFHFNTAPQRLTFTFDQDVRASLAAADLLVERLGPGGGLVAVLEPTYDGNTNTATFSFAGAPILPDGNYRATLLAAGVRNASDVPMPADAVLDFFVLTADANRDRSVSFPDLVILAQNYNQPNKTFAEGDFNYDGAVGFADLVALAQRYGTTLPAAGPTPSPPLSPVESQAQAVRRRSTDGLFNAQVPIRRPPTRTSG